MANRLFGSTGYCAACNKVIPAFEMVMRAKSNVYHLECFACQQCNHRYGESRTIWTTFKYILHKNIKTFPFYSRFCVGDRFYLCENKILCEYDYEERLVFANMPYNPSSIAHIRRQVSGIQVNSVHKTSPNTKILSFIKRSIVSRQQGTITWVSIITELTEVILCN